MAKKDGTSKSVLPTSVSAAIEGIAKGLGVAATELWSIFVRQYVVRGISELFTAIVLFATAYNLGGTIGLFALIPAGFGMAFTYGAIAYLGNPKYYALTDITKKIKELTEKDGSSSKSTSTYRGW